MRIAVGVLIIILAIGYLFGGSSVLLLGAFVDAAENGGVLAQEAKKQKKEQELSQAQAELQRLRLSGGALTAYGVFLLVLAGLAIVCGVVLFQAKAAGFAIGVAVLLLIAEGVGAYNMSKSGFNYWTVPGIVTAIFVIIAAMSYPKMRVIK